MAEVVWSTSASIQLIAILDYIEQFDPLAARRMGHRLIEIGESLSEFPQRGRPTPNGQRELVTVPPYVLRYEVDGQSVLILGIRHGARQPSG